ncbi:MAG: hypothetical protein JOZ01_06915, partial [Candidatus Eremiobacteraeota bacterium]|nr:hypothetical protein [Candidatus Eremiobacteraeota bacterium]
MCVVEFDVSQHVGTPQAARKLDFAELDRLKTARRIEVVAKLIEFLRRHRFQHVDLLRAHRHFRRIHTIQRILEQQVDILETMTPQEFNQFRDHLNPASGF